MILVAPFFPEIYQTEPEVKNLASQFIKVAALCMPMYAFNHASYFILRSGGQTLITFLFDSVFTWVIVLPLAFVLSTHTSLSIVLVYLFCQLAGADQEWDWVSFDSIRSLGEEYCALRKSFNIGDEKTNMPLVKL